MCPGRETLPLLCPPSPFPHPRASWKEHFEGRCRDRIHLTSIIFGTSLGSWQGRTAAFAQADALVQKGPGIGTDWMHLPQPYV